MRERSSLTQQEVRATFTYDPLTGHLSRIRGKGCGKPAGTLTKEGYVQVYCCGLLCLEHRLVWLWNYGALPIHEIDHINGVRNDNRLANLRDVPSEINTQNRRKARGYREAPGRRFQALIVVNGRQHSLGSYGDASAAHAAYVAAKRICHPGCTI
jgi:hypothetical protein